MDKLSLMFFGIFAFLVGLFVVVDPYYPPMGKIDKTYKMSTDGNYPTIDTLTEQGKTCVGIGSLFVLIGLIMLGLGNH